MNRISAKNAHQTQLEGSVKRRKSRALRNISEYTSVRILKNYYILVLTAAQDGSCG